MRNAGPTEQVFLVPCAGLSQINTTRRVQNEKCTFELQHVVSQCWPQPAPLALVMPPSPLVAGPAVTELQLAAKATAFHCAATQSFRQCCNPLSQPIHQALLQLYLLAVGTPQLSGSCRCGHLAGAAVMAIPHRHPFSSPSRIPGEQQHHVANRVGHLQRLQAVPPAIPQ